MITEWLVNNLETYNFGIQKELCEDWFLIWYWGRRQRQTRKLSHEPSKKFGRQPSTSPSFSNHNNEFTPARHSFLPLKEHHPRSIPSQVSKIPSQPSIIIWLILKEKKNHGGNHSNTGRATKQTRQWSSAKRKGMCLPVCFLPPTYLCK